MHRVGNCGACRARPGASDTMRVALVLLTFLFAGMVGECQELGQVHCDFTQATGWEGVNNVPAPDAGVTKTQDFGYGRTAHAGGAAGEIGGRIWRSFTPATYAKPVPRKTLNDRLHASGTFAVTESSGGSGMLVGWFNSTSRGWRTPNSLAFRIDGESGKFRVFFEYGTQTWQTGSGRTFGGRYQVTKTPMHKADGTPHRWSLDYDPAGADGAGEMTFVLDDKTYRAPLAPGHKEDGAVFNRFGIFNQQIAGQGLTVHLDNLTIDGTLEDFSDDPDWEGNGNRVTFVDRVMRPVHDFGWRETNHSGGEAGEVGGILWRIESMNPANACNYGTPVGRLTLDQEIKASGKVCLRTGAADSAILVGWYNALTPIGAPPPNFLGVFIEGPSRIGHYFRPAYGTSDDIKGVLNEGPLIRPDSQPHTWTLHYDPEACNGNGRITVTFDEEAVSLEVTPEARKGNAAFDHFGFLSWHRGGHFVEVYFDDLEFTASRIRWPQ